MKENRVESIDFIRGVCIIYMILGHVKYNVSFDHYIHAFHMPIFFVVSGIFIKNKQINKEYILKLLKKMIIPYLTWATFFYAFALITGIGLSDFPKNVLIHILTTNNSNLPIAGALWFLTSFFFANIIFLGIKKYIKNQITLTIILFFIMIFGMIFYKLTNIELWWSIESSFVGAGLMQLGSLISSTKVLKIERSNAFIFLILFIIHCIVIMLTPYVNMRTNIYPLSLLFIFNIIQSIIIYNLLYSMFIKYNITKKICTHIEYFGRFSIVSLCLNQFYLLCIDIVAENFFVNIPFYVAFKAIIAIIMLYFTTKIVMNTKIKILFGK